jgi:hypothetical protein
MKRFAEIARSPPARVAAVVAGALIGWFSVKEAGFDRVRDALDRAIAFVPIAFVLEAAIVAFDVAALRSLYGEERKRVPLRAFVRAGLLGYPVMCLLPMGRAVAEAARAAMLAKHAGAPRTAAAAARIQGVLLAANAAICFACALGASSLASTMQLPLILAANGVLMLALGSAVLAAGARSRFGSWLGRIGGGGAAAFGASLDLHLREERGVPVRAFLAAFTARIVQVAQCAVLVAAVGGRFGPLEGLAAEGVNLVGATAGDLIPAQLGATEAVFTWTSDLLSLSPSDAISIALLIHFVQMAWVAVGLVASLFWVEP